MGPQIAQLYYQHVYPWFGLPQKLISDRDPLRESASQEIRNYMEPVNSISPSNGRAYRAEEPMGGAISTLSNHQSG